MSVALLAAWGGAGCGSSPRPAAVPVAPVETVGRSGEDEEALDDDVELVSTQGKIDPEVVTRAIEPHAAALQGCYAERVGPRRWLGGEVEIRWDVAADGAITSTRLTRSDLGSWDIEKCVLDIAATVSFGAPRGGATHVAAPLTFSAGSAAMTWDGAKVERAIGGRPKELGKCARRGADPTNVHVTLYVGTRGKVQSVGFGAPAGVDIAWADCAADRAMRWELPDPRGRVAKLSFVYNPAAEAEDEGHD